MHVMAGLLQSEADRTDKELMAQWEATYVKNMKYAAQRLEEVISHGWSKSHDQYKVLLFYDNGPFFTCVFCFFQYTCCEDT